ncbi:hypothetical protein [Roseibium aestuarii]|uniref:Inner membrane protein n=1 Tax=Roseibium aestuarii TaxID=2600299 RepID=A0ABW4JZ13_9HYPH|nr:hypothetical protein [Roseibium aestuarii]
MATDKEPSGKTAASGASGGASATGSASTGQAAPGSAAKGASAAETAAQAGKGKRPVTIDLEPTKVAVKPDASGSAAAGSAAASSSAAASASAKSTSGASGDAATPASSAKPEATSTAAKPAAPSSDTAAGASAARAASKDAEKPTAPSEATETEKAARSRAFNQPPAAEPRGPGLGSLLFAAVFGGVVVVSGAYGLHVAGVLPVVGQGAEQSALQARLAELEQRLTTSGGAALDAAETRISAIEDKISALPGTDAGSGEVEAALSDLRSGLDALTERVNAGAGAPGGANEGLAQDLAAVRADLSRLEGQISAGADVSASLDTVQSGLEAAVSRLDSVEATAKAAQSAVSTSDVSLKTISDSQARASESLAALSSDVQTLSDRVASNQSAVAEQIEGLSQRLAAVEATMGDATARELAARALSIAALKSAVDSGRPYEAELAAVRAGLPGGMDLAALESHAAAGVSPAPALIAEFPAVSRAMFGEIIRPERSDDVFQSLLSSAKSLVAVRGPGDESGEGPEAELRRMETAVARADLDVALAAYDKLPEPVQAAGADWAARARARVAVDTLTRQTSQEVLRGLAGRES